MRENEVLLSKGNVLSLCINAQQVEEIVFELDGPVGDNHKGFSRIVSGHDGGYIRTSALKKKESRVFNWRSWTAISKEEIDEISKEINLPIAEGDFQENIIFSGIAGFSQLPPTSRIVFPYHENEGQLILAVWEENGPCVGVGKPFAEKHCDPSLSSVFIKAALHKRGVMGIVLSAGIARVGDEVQVYPPL